MSHRPASLRCNWTVVALGIWLAFSPIFAQEPTYTGSFADVAYLTGAKLLDWQNTGQQPRLGDKPLFDASKPVRWLQQQSLERRAQPNAFVEMVDGDRFPGRVTYWSDGLESFDERQPPHLVVSPDIGVDHPDQASRTEIRVAASSVRRVAWQRRPVDRYQPGTLFYADGRQTAFRALRWTGDAVMLLVDEGSRKVPFADIAEVHLPRRDWWDTYFETLATLSPDCSSRLMRCETYSGLVATVSLDRFQARAVSGDPAGWYQLIQPAWSLDPLWLRHTTIEWRRFFLPHQVPLSLIDPTGSTQQATFSVGRSWQRDRSVNREPLRSAGKTFGWGLGMHAQAELRFPLHPVVTQFRTQIGLDQAAADGGYAMAKVLLGNADQAVYQTKPLIGSSEVLDSGPIQLNQNGPTHSLTLVADALAKERPSGADPLDIRDMVNWLEPQLELDLGKLKGEVRARLSIAIPAWAGWEVEVPDGAQLKLTNRWDPTEGRKQRYRVESIAHPAEMRLQRRVKLTSQQNYLLLSLARHPDGTQPSKIEVLIDGQLVAKTDVRQRWGEGRFDPQVVALAPYQGREVELAVVQKPEGDKSHVQWRSVELVEYTTATPWVPLDVSAAKSSSDELKLSKQPDGSLLASGKPPEQITYAVTAQTELQGITAIRLEALTDPSLPNNGPGLAGNGNFILSDVRVTASPVGDSDAAEVVELTEAGADFSQPEYPVAGAIDDSPQTGWAVMSQSGQPHVAVFSTKRELGFAQGTMLTITLDHRSSGQHGLGRFRLAVTNVARPVPVERPALILQPVKEKMAGGPRILGDRSFATIKN